MDMKPALILTRMTCLLACFALPSFAQDSKDNYKAAIAKVCETTLCRTPKLSLYIDETHRFEQDDNSPMPILQNNELLSIFPGEQIFVETLIEDGHVKLDRAVTTNQHPERTLAFIFSQLPGKPDMVLQVKSPLPAAIRFQMAFMPVSSDRLIKTSSCPVPVGKALYEHWPHPIYQLILTNATVLKPTDDMSCK